MVRTISQNKAFLLNSRSAKDYSNRISLTPYLECLLDSTVDFVWIKNSFEYTFCISKMQSVIFV
jgi:hypothetical protein